MFIELDRRCGGLKLQINTKGKFKMKKFIVVALVVLAALGIYHQYNRWNDDCYKLALNSVIFSAIYGTPELKDLQFNNWHYPHKIDAVKCVDGYKVYMPKR